MTTWAYVQAIVDNDFVGGQKPGETLPVSFRHMSVQAENESAAYSAGHLWSEAQDNTKVSLLNDYVFTI